MTTQHTTKETACHSGETLEAFLQRTDLYAEEIWGGVRVFRPTHKQRIDLYGLSDFMVGGTLSGPSVFMVRRAKLRAMR